jgi:acyl-CoA reductase-like NAD-dependent aldehyde dehydrogenase
VLPASSLYAYAAFLAGCSYVDFTPSTGARLPALRELAERAGLPEDVWQVVLGRGRNLGSALIERADFVDYTGSTATGRTLMREAGPLFKKITLELGGHCPAIVCEDADLAAAAKAIAYKAFRNMGQSCSTINRIYAHASIHDRLVELVAAEARKLSIGDGIEPPDVDLGPMTTRAALAKVEAHVADAVARGATVVHGGKAPDGRTAGNFYQPTVLTGMKPEMLMMREETFGPVAPFAAYTDLEQAITAANDSDFGLCAFLFTRELGRTMRVSERLESGTVCVNHVAVNTTYGPYEGWKASGFGVELGRCAIDEYLHRKHIKIAVPSC